MQEEEQATKMVSKFQHIEFTQSLNFLDPIWDGKYLRLLVWVEAHSSLNQY